LESGHVDVLRASVVPRLTKLCARLQMERHETVIDERLDQATPSCRMRMRPWQAPFTGPQAAAGSVLEILLSQGPTPEILGRLYIGSDSTPPTHQIRVEVSKLTDAWLDRLLLDFVERALR